MSFTTYPSDLTDAEWQYLEPLLPTPKATGRLRQWPLRLILNGIFYLVRSGCAWRILPKGYPHWPTVAAGYTQRCRSRQPEHQDQGKREPAGAPRGASSIGYDSHKKVKGRKRHLLVDTQGVVFKVKATGAHLAERDGACELLEPLRSQLPRLQIVWADQGYSGGFETWMQERLGWRLEFVRRTIKSNSTLSSGPQRVSASASAAMRRCFCSQMWAGPKSGHGIEY